MPMDHKNKTNKTEQIMTSSFKFHCVLFPQEPAKNDIHNAAVVGNLCIT